MTNFSFELQQEFLQIINEKTGISIRPKDQENFYKNLKQRMIANSINSFSEYYQLLKGNNNLSQQEWQKLTLLLTNLESYFFRDKGQIKILQTHILPKLAHQNKIHKSLNIISAGCSTGEEVYSLAILIKEILDNFEEWNIKIVGLDLNLEALEKAKKGIYGNWSLRSMSQEKKDSYFNYINHQYHILDEYKRIVRFHHFNLVNDTWDKINPPPDNIDLIICRNVFIYFDSESIQKVVNKFKNILRINGYLMTGHAEVDSNKMKEFKAKSFPESLIYLYNPYEENKTSFVTKSPENKPLTPLQNLTNNINPQIIIPEIKPLPFNKFNNPTTTNIVSNFNNPSPISDFTLPSKIEDNSLFIATQKLIKDKLYNQAIENTKKLIEQYPQNILPYQMMADICANSGDYFQAKNYCELALKIDNFAVYPHYILSHIADANGDLEESKKLLKKIIYLEPNFLVAYVELANIYQIENDVNMSQKMWKNLGELLNKLPDNQVIPELDNLTVSELKNQIRSKL